MSTNSSDPALNTQFRRDWEGQRVSIKFLSERDLDRVVLQRGDRILRRLPPAIVADLRVGERQDLARAFGRPWLRRLREQRSQQAQPVTRRG